jgi:outer membrane protein insertion porin family
MAAFAHRSWTGWTAVFLVVVIAAAVTAFPRRAFAIGEMIVDVRVHGNTRTAEETVRSIAGVRIGDTLENETLKTVRERLNTSGLFADVNVWWENQGEGVRVNIEVKDKFPWAPVPTGSWSANYKSLGLVFVHGNLFGRGKQLLVGGRLANLDSGAIVAYRDPALFGTWMYWEMRGIAQRVVIPEYDVHDLVPPSPWRETTLDSFGVEPVFGVAWFRRVRTQVSWRVDRVAYKKQQVLDPTTGADISDPATDPPTGTFANNSDPRVGIVGIGRAAVAFDWRAREQAIMMGPALGGTLDISSPAFLSDIEFWRASVFWEQGFRIFRRQNLIYSVGGTLGHNLPIWWDTTAGGTNLRGYLVQQFRGDTQANAKVEYHFPLFSVGSLDVRGLGFYDFSAIYFRDLPPATGQGSYLMRSGPYSDQRTFDSRYTVSGFDPNRDLHNDVGAGLRFFLRSVAVPLIGFDAGFGLESRHWNFILIVGA